MTSTNKQTALFNYLLNLADDRLILGHRLSEMCGHGPILEEDIATTNIALDLIGQANYLLEYAATVEDKGRSADDLAFLRDEKYFTNILLCEQENTDFAYIIARQFFFDSFAYLQFAQLRDSKDETLSALAKRSFKEITYHLRHSSQWMLHLGDGTEESNEKMQEAIDYLWMFTGEMFEQTEGDKLLINEGIICDTAKFKDEWFANVSTILKEATLNPVNKDDYMQTGGRKGKHTEYLGHILAEMQNLQRSYPDAQW